MSGSYWWSCDYIAATAVARYHYMIDLGPKPKSFYKPRWMYILWSINSYNGIGPESPKISQVCVRPFDFKWKKLKVVWYIFPGDYGQQWITKVEV